MTKPKYAQVVLGLPLDRAFTYSIPKDFKESVKVGQRVEVPFGQRVKMGYIVGFLNQASIRKVKPLKAIIDQEPLLDRKMLQLTRQVADYYYASWGEVIEAAHPASVRKRKKPFFPQAPQVPFDSGLLEFELTPEKFSLSPQQKHALSLIKKVLKKKDTRSFSCMGLQQAERLKFIFRL